MPLCQKSSLVAQRLKHLPAMWETWVRSLSQEDPLEKEIATHSSIRAWRIPWMEEPGGLQSMGSQRVGHDWVTSLHFHFLCQRSAAFIYMDLFLSSLFCSINYLCIFLVILSYLDHCSFMQLHSKTWSSVVSVICFSFAFSINLLFFITAPSLFNNFNYKL